MCWQANETMKEKALRLLRPLLTIVVLAVLCSSGVIAPAAAQSPTAIAVPSPTSEGCDQVPAYLQQRQEIFDALIADLTAIFPDVATPITEHGPELLTAMMSMDSKQLEELAKAYDAAADKIEATDAPPVATFYNGIQVQIYRLSADLFADAATSGLAEAGARFADQLTALGEASSAAGAGATSVCPAFDKVVELDQTQIAM